MTANSSSKIVTTATNWSESERGTQRDKIRFVIIFYELFRLATAAVTASDGFRIAFLSFLPWKLNGTVKNAGRMGSRWHPEILQLRSIRLRFVGSFVAGEIELPLRKGVSAVSFWIGNGLCKLSFQYDFNGCC